jgi:hypothetical protein
VDDEEILACVAEVLGLEPEGGTVTPLGGKQGLFVCRVTLPGSPALIFKAVRESCRQELRLSAWLSEAVPYAVPNVLHSAEDVRRGYYWLVMRDEGPCRLSDRPAIQTYARAAETLARVQIDMMAAVPALRELGLREMDATSWEEMSLSLLSTMEGGNLRVVCEGSVLTDSLWKVGDMAKDASMIPASLIHGDLHSGNILVDSDDRVRLLDWGSSYIGAAHLGLAELLWPASRFGKQLGDLGPVRKAYTDQWVPILGKPGRLAAATSACEALSQLSLLHESLRRPERFGEFGAASVARQFVESYRHWERARAC